MENYRKKPVIVQAEQFTGQPIEGMRLVKNEIIYSRDKKLFYVSNSNARDWLSVEEAADGKYEAYPFMMYEIKSHHDREDAEGHPLEKLYLKMFNLERDEPCGYVDSLGGTVKVIKGDWVIKGINGEMYPCKPDVFEAMHEKI